MSPFRALADHEIHALDDEEILGYALRARAAGRPADAARGLQILAWGYRPIVRLRVLRRVPEEVAEDVGDAALLRAIAQLLKEGAFRGASTGEFRRRLHTITDRQVADYFRARERRVAEEPLPEEHEGDEDERRRPAGQTGDETAAVEVQALIDQALSELNPSHREVVERYVFDGCSATETAQAVAGEMSENNVHKIAERFRKRMHELLEES